MRDRFHRSTSQFSTQKLSREEEQRIMGISAMLTLPIATSGIIYFILLKTNNVISSYEILALYSILWIPVSTTIYLAAYEVLMSRKIKKPLHFHFRRFLSRTTVLSGYWFLFLVSWSLLNLLLNRLVSWRYILLLAFLTASVFLAVLVVVPKTRLIIEKFTKGE